jgi:phosphatidate cytidylyltransferase
LKELLLRTLTGILLIVLVAGAILLGALPFLGVLLLIYTLGMRELFSLYPRDNSSGRWIYAVPGFVWLIIFYAVLNYHWSYFLLGLPIALWLLVFLIKGLDSASTLSLFWLAIPLACYFSVGWIELNSSYGPLIPLAVISLLWINDTFAYVTGNLFGKHKLTPRLSPGKTWEGLLGGFLFSLLGGWIIFNISGIYSLAVWISLSTLVSGLSLCGDLFESGIKRKKSVKNSGEILPGHGGILDRFDSLLFVAPGAFLLFLLINILS